MKNKKNLWILVSHMIVLAGFTLLQGCATGECPVDWLNWPYNSPANEPILVSENDDFDSLLLPPVAPGAVDADSADFVMFAEPVVTDPVVSMEPSQSYMVKKGDTLSSIASMYGTTWKKLAEFNGLSNPNILYVNQEILIPGSLNAPAPVSRSSAPTGSSVSTSGGSPIKQGSSYVIKRGDTLSGIAGRSGLSVQEIQAANALDSHVIVAGKSLSIPKKGEINVSSSARPDASSVMETAPEPAPEPAPLADIAPAESASSAPVYDHVLYPGETLDDVARQYGSTKDEIMMLNGITDPDALKPGTKLLVPIPE